MCLYSFHICYSNSSIFSKGIRSLLEVREYKSLDSGNTFSVTISSNTYTLCFDVRYQRHFRHLARLAGRVPIRSGHTLVMAGL
jgi:hypothetical protein